MSGYSLRDPASLCIHHTGHTAVQQQDQAPPTSELETKLKRRFAKISQSRLKALISDSAFTFILNRCQPTVSRREIGMPTQSS